MLRPKVQLNLHNAREYFRAHLRVGDYYSEGQEIEGEWLGAAAEALGLTGSVKEEAFLALCEGRHPQTGARLTQRLNSTRSENGRLVANRRIFHDFTISPPVSVPAVALCCDKRIVEIHDRAVRIGRMSELELFAGGRACEKRAKIARVQPATSSLRAFVTIAAANLIPISTPTAWCSTRRTIEPSTGGRHSRRKECIARKNLRRTFISTSWPRVSAHWATRLKTMRGILKFGTCHRGSLPAFQNGTSRSKPRRSVGRQKDTMGTWVNCGPASPTNIVA